MTEHVIDYDALFNEPGVIWEQRNADFCKAQLDAEFVYIEAGRRVKALEDENAKLRELAVLNWEWAHSCCNNNCKMHTDGCGHQIDRDCNYEREIWYRMRELGVEP